MRQIFLLWLFFRLVTSLGIIFASYASNHSINDLLCSQSASECLTKMLIETWRHWDVDWYLEILHNGHQPDNGTLQFHPLYPSISRIGTAINLSPLFSLLLVSSVSALLFMIIFYHLARLDLTEEESRFSLLLLGFFPISFILFAPYPESLFLACSGLCFYAMRKQRWWLAGIAGAMAALTRQQGLLLILPLVWEAWQVHRPNWRAMLRPQPAWAAPLMIAGGYFSWVLVRGVAFNETFSKPANLNELIYSFFISPTANQVVPSQAFLPPVIPVWLAIQQFLKNPDVDLTLNLFMTIWFLLTFAFGWTRMNDNYRLYSLAILLISMSYYTGPIHPVMGLPRHLYLAFPVFIGLAPQLKAPPLRLAWVGLGLLGTLALLLGFYMEAWVP